MVNRSCEIEKECIEKNNILNLYERRTSFARGCARTARGGQWEGRISSLWAELYKLEASPVRTQSCAQSNDLSDPIVND